MGQFFSKPFSLDPSMAIKKRRLVPMELTKMDQKYGAREPLNVQVIFVFADTLFCVIPLSFNISLKKGTK